MVAMYMCHINCSCFEEDKSNQTSKFTIIGAKYHCDGVTMFSFERGQIKLSAKSLLFGAHYTFWFGIVLYTIVRGQ